MLCALNSKKRCYSHIWNAAW